jgi:hypothetical protein
MLKLLVGAALVAAPVPVAPSETITIYVQYPQVAQVRCLVARGTAFRAAGKWISVEHVTSQGGCFVEGQPIVSPANEKGLDFSIIGPAKLKGLRIDCSGFKKDEFYYAIGFAHGHPIQRLIILKGTGDHADNGMAVLFGSPTLIPGMSGGPILNSKGAVVGVNSMYSKVFPLSLSRELKDTSVCKGNAGA